MSKFGSIEHSTQFYRGALVGSVLVIIKFIFFLPANVADVLYGIVLLATLAITAGELMGLEYFSLEKSTLDSIVGFLFPLDFYAVLILFGIHLTN